MKWLVAIASVAAACAPAPPRRLVHPVADACADHDATAARHWEQRASEAEVRAALDAWWRATSACAPDPARYLAIARGDQLLAEGHVALREPGGEEYIALLADGAAAAEQGLAVLSPRFADRRRDGAGVADAIDVLDASAVPLLYWWAQDTILAASAQGLRATIAVHADVRAVMERVAELDPAYWYGGADRYLGAFYASAPAIAGGDLERARAHLDLAVQRAPGFLENLLVYAVTYARAAGDDDLYHALLEEIVAAPPDDDPEIAIEQRITQDKARRLLE